MFRIVSVLSLPLVSHNNTEEEASSTSIAASASEGALVVLLVLLLVAAVLYYLYKYAVKVIKVVNMSYFFSCRRRYRTGCKCTR